MWRAEGLYAAFASQYWISQSYLRVLQDTVIQACVTNSNTCVLHHSPVHSYLHKCTGLLGVRDTTIVEYFSVRDTTVVDQTGKHAGPPAVLKIDSKQRKWLKIYMYLYIAIQYIRYIYIYMHLYITVLYIRYVLLEGGNFHGKGTKTERWIGKTRGKGSEFWNMWLGESFLRR